nr:hypothetical protein CFP56_54931 [Quercus suber]
MLTSLMIAVALALPETPSGQGSYVGLVWNGGRLRPSPAWWTAQTRFGRQSSARGGAWQPDEATPPTIARGAVNGWRAGPARIWGDEERGREDEDEDEDGRVNPRKGPPSPPSERRRIMVGGRDKAVVRPSGVTLARLAQSEGGGSHKQPRGIDQPAETKSVSEAGWHGCSIYMRAHARTGDVLIRASGHVEMGTAVAWALAAGEMTRVRAARPARRLLTGSAERSRWNIGDEPQAKQRHSRWMKRLGDGFKHLRMLVWAPERSDHVTDRPCDSQKKKQEEETGW